MGRQLAAPQLPELLGPRPLAPVHVGTEHLLLGLLCEGRRGGAEVLESFGISLKAVREQAGELIGAGQQAPSGLILPTASARKALQQSVREAQQLGQDYVGTEHILLALTREGDDGAAQILVRLGADLGRVRRQAIRLLGERPEPAMWSGPPEEMLTDFGSRPPGSGRRPETTGILAVDEARMHGYGSVDTEHILLGLISDGEGVAAKALASLGISLQAVRSQLEEITGQGQQAPSGRIPFTPAAGKVLELSMREALQFGHDYIGGGHILLGLIREGDGVAARVLAGHDADLNCVRQRVRQLLPIW